MPEMWNKTGNLYFGSDASLMKRVGRESISNPIVAIVELIKNSYDADATEVKVILENIKLGRGIIRIIDNGSGMTPEDLSKNWMVLSTDDKEKNPLTKKFKRVKIGEKGIGRIGIEGISKEVEIISKPEKMDKMYQIKINWEDYVSGTLLDKIPNTISEAPKPKRENGFEIILSNLYEVWDDEKVKQLKEQISLIQPIGIDLSFSVKLKCEEFSHYEGEIEKDFLKKYIFHFKAELENNKVKYFMKHRGGNSYKLEEKEQNFLCGDFCFEFYFYYRNIQRYPDKKIDINQIKEALDNYGGIKLYRDDFLVKLQKEDWIGLDKMRVQDPSINPGTNQVFGCVKLTKAKNKDIRDTTNRDGMIENESYKDMMRFIYKSISNFKMFRKQAEYRKDKRKKKPVQVKFKVKSKSTKETKVDTLPKEFLLDFGKQYPDVFYEKLEEEINQCYNFKLPNASFFLCRKLIENMIYNILEKKFPNDETMWWSIKEDGELLNHALALSPLIKNLRKNKSEFKPNITKYIENVLPLLEKFRNKINPTAHNIYNYLDSIEQLDEFKIVDLIQLLINIYNKF